jgi:DNA-binding response OmpR family regulator
MATERESGPILVVEDDRDLAEVVVDVLALEGFEVAHADNGRVALEMCAQRTPRLILLDMKMPVMDGWEFARRFRHEFHNATPIIVVTAAESAAQRCREIGADAWLAKPFDLDELRALVRKSLAAARAEE